MTIESRTTGRIPAAVVRRLPKYLTHAQHLRHGGIEWVSSATLADALGLTSSTVRQDLSYVEFQGISKRGYSTEGLDAAVSLTLGLDHHIRCVVVGAGNLGRALALHNEFVLHGFRIVGVFDNASGIIDKKVGRHRIQPMSELRSVIRRQKVEIGIIAVPFEAGQPAANALIEAGANGLLNMTAAHLLVPERISVVDARILASLRELAYAVKSRRT